MGDKNKSESDLFEERLKKSEFKKKSVNSASNKKAEKNKFKSKIQKEPLAKSKIRREIKKEPKSIKGNIKSKPKVAVRNRQVKNSVKSGSNSYLFHRIVTVLLVFGLLIVLAVFVFMFYFLYKDFLVDPENINVDVNIPFESFNSTDSVKQFYPGMKFNHNLISYKIDPNCRTEKTERVIQAFNDISEDTENIIRFYQSSDNPDIDVSCSSGEEILDDSEFFIAGEGGAKEIIQTGRYNIITKGVILLNENPHGFNECNWPNVEIHELMHVFGFDHSSDPNSLMYPYLESCNQKLDNSIKQELKRLYSQKNLPDLYFEDVDIVKKGRYIDFNLTVKNAGSVDANAVNFSILEDGELTETRDLGDISFGAGIFVEIRFFKLKDRDSKEVNFFIDYENKIEEVDDQNNVVKVKFDD
jgi:hypothetical protein